MIQEVNLYAEQVLDKAFLSGMFHTITISCYSER